MKGTHYSQLQMHIRSIIKPNVIVHVFSESQDVEKGLEGLDSSEEH